MTTVAPVSPVMTASGDTQRLKELYAVKQASLSLNTDLDTNGKNVQGPTADKSSSLHGVSSMPIMSFSHHINLKAAPLGPIASAGSAPVTPPASLDASSTTNTTDDNNYTTSPDLGLSASKTAPVASLSSLSSSTSPTSGKLYLAGSGGLSKSANFMHKHKRGFPERTGDDHLSSALMFGHSNHTSSSSSSSLSASEEGSTASSSLSSPELCPEKALPASANQQQLPALEPTSSASTITPDHYYSSDDQKIVRKKSGERVKSSLKLPGLVRTKSLPSTASKMVHFDSTLEQVRRFSKGDMPTAVSADSSPVEEHVRFHWGNDDDDDDGSSSSSASSDDEDDRKIGYYHYMNNTEWSIQLPNFVKPGEDNDKHDAVYLEHVFLSSNKSTLVGHVAVKNLCYHKQVVVRYTVDYWKTVTEVSANYNDDVRKKLRANGYDRFTFAIDLHDLPQRALSTKSMFFCIRYSASGQEFWDNNNSYNYQIDFKRVNKEPKPAGGGRRVAAGRHRRSTSADEVDVSIIPGRQSMHSRSRSEDLDKHFHTPEMESESISMRGRAPTKPKASLNNNKLTARYSFGSSYHNRHDDESDGIFSFPSSSKKAPSLPLNANSRPAWDSRSYQDFLDNYCFFNEAKSSSRGKDKADSSSSSATTTTSTRALDSTANTSSSADSVGAASASTERLDLHRIKSPKAGIFV